MKKNLMLYLECGTPKADTCNLCSSSVFKLITSSIGLEENLVKTDTAGDLIVLVIII